MLQALRWSRPWPPSRTSPAPKPPSSCGVSTTTLDNWISKGLLPLRKVPDYKRERVPTEPLLALATEVKELRRMGRHRGLLAAALARLEQEDPAWAEEFAELYGKEAKRPFDARTTSAPPPVPTGTPRTERVGGPGSPRAAAADR